MEQHDGDDDSSVSWRRRRSRSRTFLKRFRQAIVSVLNRLSIFNSCRFWEVASQEPFRRRTIMEARVLVLGASDTGKSTFMKQMRYVFGDTYPVDDRRSHLPHIRRNLLESLHMMVRAMDNFGIAQASQEAREAAQRFSDMDSLEQFIEEDAAVDSLLVQQTQALWSDPGVREVYKRGNEYHLLTNAGHFISKAREILADGYLPTVDDILRMRYPTQGAVTITYNLGEMQMTLHDMGGQRSERRGWINHLNSPTAVLFLASLSEYDQTVEEATEDVDKNRVQESLDIFTEVLRYPPFINVPVIVLLNKSDIFRQKIQYHALKDYLPAYDGPEKDEQTGREFIASLYAEVANSHSCHFFSRFTEATNTDNFKTIFSYIKNHVSRSMIGRAGLF